MVKLRYLLLILWLLLLIGYVLGGVSVTPFHGDEAMQITMSADYDTAFIQHNPAVLTVTPPYAVDSPAWLRLINGSVNRYLIGLIWHLTGFSAGDLPPIWQWPVSYDENVTQGNRPSEALLTIARWPSALLLGLSVVVMFGLGYGLGGWRAAVLASGFYALHPIILINGRRAMQEGAMLFFGLLCIWIGMQVARRLSERRSVSWGWWAGLALTAGLTLASKHSGIVFVAAAFGWVGATILQIGFKARTSPTAFFAAPLLLCLSAVIASLLLLLVLSPALWNDPVARLGDLLTERAALLESQVIAAGGATSLSDRVMGILTQPFFQPAELYEAGFWANSSAFMTEVQTYRASVWVGGVPGILFAVLALIGLGRALVGLRAGDAAERMTAWGLLLCLMVTVATLLVNPLLWQRYYLPLLPIAILLAAWGGAWITRWGRGNYVRTDSPLVRSSN